MAVYTVPAGSQVTYQNVTYTFGSFNFTDAAVTGFSGGTLEWRPEGSRCFMYRDGAYFRVAAPSNSGIGRYLYNGASQTTVRTNLNTITVDGMTSYSSAQFGAGITISNPPAEPAIIDIQTVSVTPSASSSLKNLLASWLVVHGGFFGYSVTYDLKSCVGASSNPVKIPEDATATTLLFTPDENMWFTPQSVSIEGDGFPSGSPVAFSWDHETGTLVVGPITSDIIVHVKAFSDPYGPGGTSGPGGGGGTFDFGSDIIGLPPLPTLSFADTGFTRIYNPTLSQLNLLADYLWTDQTFLQTVTNHLKQLLENPMDAVISLSLLPCSIPNGSPETVKVMYVDTGISMSPATTQFVDVDCGTYTIEEAYGSALDYNPYTKVHCYLPYIGQVTLDTDEVMGKTLRVIYRIDIVTGMCSAMISVTQGPEMDINILYQFSGHCAINMPLNSADFSGYIGAAMTAGKMVAGVAAGAAGASALAAELIGAPAPHSSTSETAEKTTERNPATGRQITKGTTTRTTTHSAPGASFGEMSRKAAANTVNAVMGSKLTIQHAGGFTGNSGYLAVRRPYLIIERPRMCNPEEYGKYNGRPSMIYMNLGDCDGYTEVQSIQFENIPATNPELAELSELLKSGVLF